MPTRRTSAPADGLPLRGSHATQVFGGAFPHTEVAALARGAHEAGEAVVLILHARRLAVMRRLLAPLRRVTYVNTHQALAAMTRGKGLDEELVNGTLASVVGNARRDGNGRVAIFTDAAGTLVLQGRHNDSRRLEGLCHGVCSDGPVFLMCVYPVEAYAQLGKWTQPFRHEHGLAKA